MKNLSYFIAAFSLAIVSGALFLHSDSAIAIEAAKSENALSSGSQLRVCSAHNEMPYSNIKEEGFENKLALLLGKATNRKVTFVWSKRPAIYLVRDFLDQKKCDLIVGLDSGDKRVLTTKSYYRSGYAFVFRKDRGLDIKDWDSPDLKKLGLFGVAFGTPGEVMLKKIGKWDDSFNYMHSLVNFKSRRNQFVRAHPARMVSEVANGKADIAIVWAPEAARYIKQSKVPLEMVMIPDNAVREDGEKVPFQFDQVMGVRKDDKKLLAVVNEAISKAKSEIRNVLKSEGIPLLSTQAKSG